jgi:hypothetical protein
MHSAAKGVLSTQRILNNTHIILNMCTGHKKKGFFVDRGEMAEMERIVLDRREYRCRNRKLGLVQTCRGPACIVTAIREKETRQKDCVSREVRWQGRYTKMLANRVASHMRW